jgi:amidase
LECFFWTTFRAASEIVRCIERGEWTASKVIEAYIARAAMAHQATNCITEGRRDHNE